jgi:hypothetical protein
VTSTDRLKAYASEKVFIARLQGRLIPGPCENADDSCRGVICGHHRNGYEPEHALDVVWLCASHHNREHAALRRALEAAEATA